MHTSNSSLDEGILVRTLACLALFIGVLAYPAFSASDQVLFREDFHDLSAWKDVFFPKIPQHTVYRVERSDSESYLVARSDASASLLVYKRSFDVYEYPNIRWRWKVSNIYKNADPKVKSGDDYPIRIYIAFAYDPQKAGPIDRAIFNAARLIYGEYPPSGSLNYVWSSKVLPERTIASPYTDRNRMIFLEKGSSHVGQWADEEVNILKDYEAIFKKKPPRHATIGIMNDSDNTGEKATSYVDFIEVYRTEK
jgi:hypothetical protein